MARAIKPDKGLWLTFSPQPFTLPDDTATGLAAILKIDQSSDAFTRMKVEVEGMLGCYPGMVKTMDKAPRAAAKAKAIRPLVKRADELLQGLDDIDSASISALGTAYRVELINELCWFAGRADKVCKELEATESRGAPKMTARQYVIDVLCDIYMRYAIEPENNGRLNFITSILDAAEIPYEDNDFRLLKNLPRL